jgi:hypothetical protein
LPATYPAASAATNAAAIPTDCTISFGAPRTVSSVSGTGEHRIRMLQRHFQPGRRTYSHRRPVGTVDQRYTAHEIVDVWIDKRG